MWGVLHLRKYDKFERKKCYLESLVCKKIREKKGHQRMKRPGGNGKISVRLMPLTSGWLKMAHLAIFSDHFNYVFPVALR